MKIKGFITAASALMLFSSLASAGDPVQMWKCNVNGYDLSWQRTVGE